MTTIALPFEGMDIPQFVFLNNGPTKDSNRAPRDIQNQRNNSKKPQSPNSRNNSNKKSNQGQQSNKKSRKAATKAQKGMTNSGQMSRNLLKVHTLERFETQHHIPKVVKGNGLKSSFDKYNKLAYLSTASESDDYSSQFCPELNGFKIVHSGKVLHDGTEEELESPIEFTMKGVSYQGAERFASSTLVIGPNAKNISLPTFV
jgi:hypothetical protein